MAHHRLKYVVVTPVRNEAKCLADTIASMVRQTLLPERWVIVDDGSTDGTGDLIAAAARANSWITAVRRPDRGFRKSGGGVVEAFYDGYVTVREERWEFIVKLDGDLTFDPNYFEGCIAKFADDPCLGIGGGTILVGENGQFIVDSPSDPPFHVRGATKIYRRACWEQISPLVRAPGWDTVDEVKANMQGWCTRTFAELTLVQQRGTGSTDGMWRNWYKNGLANYVTGYHPIFMLAKCARRAFQGTPLAAVALCVGFCAGYAKRLPRVEDASAVRYLRRQQVRRLMSRPSIYTDVTKAKKAAS